MQKELGNSSLDLVAFSQPYGIPDIVLKYLTQEFGRLFCELWPYEAEDRALWLLSERGHTEGSEDEWRNGAAVV